MRIQHNILAMNSYRNYSNNVGALGKNLEKLSSGYKINRAGDDAAGLAISEKMRAQISGLNAAQKNVKDGISLVKTAEGAMQEIQDMLNRMKYLATQSANGTYDDTVDRANLQKEVDSLRSEIDRIAESANFNGIKLLDGSWQGKTTLASVQGAAGGPGSQTPTPETETYEATFGTPSELTALGMSNVKFEGLTEDIKSIEFVVANAANAADDATAKAALDSQGKLTITLHQKGSGGSNDFDDIDVKAAINNAIADAAQTEDKLKNVKFDGTVTGATLDGATAGDKATGTVGKAAKASRAASSGARQAEDLTFDSAEADKIGMSGIKLTGLPDTIKKVTITVGDANSTEDGDGSAKAALADEGATLAITITPKNGSGTEVDASAIEAEIQKLEGLDKVTFEGTVGTFAKGTATAEVMGEEDGDGDKKTESAGDPVEIDLSTIKENFTAGDTVTVGGKVFKFQTAPKARESGTTDDPFLVNVGADINASLQNLAAKIEANKDTLGVSASFNSATSKLTLTPTKEFASGEEFKKAVNVTVTGANKTAFETAWNDAVEKAAEKIDASKGTGNGLLLQIGDTSDPYNQLRVEIGKMTTTAMGIDQITIADQAGAAAAIDKIKDAINYVSSVRGDLGAYQNRLEHTQNNLSVMAENIQDAESTIRDTDVAEEMMSYVKNNILVQSAQAMLAQANQVPQGVLQLLG